MVVRFFGVSLGCRRAWVSRFVGFRGSVEVFLVVCVGGGDGLFVFFRYNGSGRVSGVFY